MPVTGINDQMLQYGKGLEYIYKNKPKTPKAYGIKTPDTRNVIVALTAIFSLLVIASELM
ncbi:MAG: hypothetical protein PHQ34_10830 [Methanothrix sp.]|nr:hypothetical protein [Methanothrix sp.]